MNDCTVKRNPSTCALLSLLVSGLGQIYCGQFGKGIVFYFLSFLGAVFLPLLVIAKSPILLAVSGIACGLSTAVWLYSIVDAWRYAKKLKDGYALKEYNRGYVYVILFALFIPFGIGSTFYFRATAMEAFFFADNSMAPALNPGDRFLVNKLAYENKLPEKNDLIAFHSLTTPGRRLLRRVVGLPGETVEVVDGALRIGGQQVAPSVVDVEPLTIPDGYVYVLCENLESTSDSRQFGPVPWVALIGRVELVYWPRIERFSRQETLLDQ